MIDSPFSDFLEITKQIALKKMAVPEFLLEFALGFINDSFENLLKDETRDNKIYNPFYIRLGSEQDIDTGIPTVFLYCSDDEVVDKSHSEAIIKNYRARFERVIMEGVTHNQNRPHGYLKRVFELLHKFGQKVERDRRRMSLGNLHSSHNDSIDQDGSMIRRGRGISVQSK